MRFEDLFATIVRVVLGESTDRIIHYPGVLCVRIQRRMYPHQRTNQLVRGGSPVRSRLYLHSRVGFATLYTRTHRGEQLFASLVLIRRCGRGVAAHSRCGRPRGDGNNYGKSATTSLRETAPKAASAYICATNPI